MSTNLKDLLARLASHGEPRGADTILDAAEMALRGEEAIMAVGWKNEQEQSWIKRLTRGRYRGWAVAVGSAAVTLLVGGGVLLLLSSGDQAPDVAGSGAATTVPSTADSVAATTTEPPATSTTAAPVPIVGLAWTRVPAQESLGTDEGVTEQSLDVVIAGGPGLIAAGSTEDGAALWTSVDGIEWARVADPDGVFERGSVSGLAVGPDRHVAVGNDARRARVWTSVDGLEWTEVESPSFEPSAGGGDLTMEGIAFGPAGFVAVGFEAQPGDNTMVASSAVWLSADGLEWERLEAGFLNARPPIVMHDVISTGTGYLAMGANWRTERAGAWVSPDGRAWTEADSEGLVGSLEMEGAASVDGVLVGTAWGVAWVSEDGLNWTLALRKPGEEELLSTWGVAGNHGVIIVVGSIQSTLMDSPGTALAMASFDSGETWERYSEPAEVFGPGDPPWDVMNSIVEFDGKFVVVGHSNYDGTVWIAEPLTEGS